MKRVPGGVISARGFRAGGVSCGIKNTAHAFDLGIIFSDLPTVAAGMFTTNNVKAAPVRLDRERLKRGKIRGIAVNSGNANACTGDRGMRDAQLMAGLAANSTGLADPRQFLVASTGIIGRHLPMSKIEQGIRAAALHLGRSPRHAAAIAQAIMTTDTCIKTCSFEVMLSGKAVRIGGIAKGAGMISPSMATLLAFITTDCAISAPMLRKVLRTTVQSTFNCVTVDGDMSTNDSILVLANGAAGNMPIRGSGKSFDIFLRGFYAVAEHLAQAVIRDGEGATRFVEVLITGARSIADARRVALSIANSLLVKTAIHGGDPNWGRIICAAGYSNTKLDPKRMRLWLNGLLLFRGGVPCAVALDRLEACMKPKEIQIRLDLGSGSASTKAWTCDLSREYVSINSEYHT